MRNQLNKLYRQAQMDSAPSGRQIEISILELAASKLQAHLPKNEKLAWSHDLNEAMKFNQKVWDVFSADWMNPESQLSIELRQNLLSIAIFVKKKTFALIAKPDVDGLRLLIQLNENIIDGLKAPKVAASTASA
jgi:flagellar protein FlaF